RVELRAPDDDVEVQSARARVQLAFSVEDDHGIGAIELVWRVADARDHVEHRVGVRTGRTPPERSETGLYEWDLADTDLDAGARRARAARRRPHARRGIPRRAGARGRPAGEGHAGAQGSSTHAHRDAPAPRAPGRGGGRPRARAAWPRARCALARRAPPLAR